MRQTDPQAVGEFLLRDRENHPDVPLHILANGIPWNQIETLPSHTSMQADATEVYQSELRERRDSGDKFAKAVLEEGGWNEPIEQ